MYLLINADSYDERVTAAIEVIPRDIVRLSEVVKQEKVKNGNLRYAALSCHGFIICVNFDDHPDLEEKIDINSLVVLENLHALSYEEDYEYRADYIELAVSVSHVNFDVFIEGYPQPFESIEPIPMKFFTDLVGEPKNNDGRSSCYWCGGVLETKDLALTKYQYCNRCGK